jgi:deoxycytidine triphosphate deaminase
MRTECVVPGFLSDREIRAALGDGSLLERQTWDADAIRPASYAIRLGENVHVRMPGQPDFTVIVIGDHRSTLTLQPGATAKLYSLERLQLPNDVLAFTVARGLLFAQPLVPENTYVDPGFSGPIYTVVTNITGQAVDLEYKMPIARLFFYRLDDEVEVPYVRAAAAGIREHLDEHDVIDPPTPGEASQATFKKLVSASAAAPIPGNFIHAELFSRLRRRLDWLVIAVVAWPPTFMLIYESHRVRQALGGRLITGIFSAIVIYVLIWGGPRALDRFRRH